MNIRRLEYFHVLAQMGHLHRASEMLNISPPALSKAMKVLEDELETKLWARNGRRLLLTDAGQRLLRRTPALMEELRSLRENLTKDEGPECCKPIRIATFEVFSTYFLSYLDDFKRPLELHEVLPGELENAVASGKADYGITYMAIPHPDLDFLKVTQIEMGVFFRRGSFRGVAQEDLPFVVPVMPLQGVPTRIRGLDGWPEDAFRRKVAHQVTLMESALELCRQGKAAGYFPVFVANGHNARVRDEYRLDRSSNPHCPYRRHDVFLVKRKADDETSIVKKLTKSLRQTARSNS